MTTDLSALVPGDAIIWYVNRPYEFELVLSVVFHDNDRLTYKWIPFGFGRSLKNRLPKVKSSTIPTRGSVNGPTIAKIIKRC